MNDSNLDITFTLNTAQVEQELRATRERIRGVGDEARTQEGILQRLERAAAIFRRGMTEATVPENIDRYNRRLQQTQAEIQRLTTLTERSGRAGQLSFSGVQNSLTGMLGELPVFADSAEKGFIALSNHIPSLIGEIGKLKAANAELSASGQATVPVWKQMANSLFSWGGLLSVGQTLLTAFGSQLISFGMRLYEGNRALNVVAESQKLNIDIQEKAIKSYAKEFTHLDILKNVITDKTLSMKRRNAALKEYNSIADDSNQIDITNINNSSLIEGAISRQIVLIQKRALAKAAESVIEEKAQVYYKKKAEVDQKYPRFSDDALHATQERGLNAIRTQGKKLGLKPKDFDPQQLYWLSSMPKEGLKKIAAERKEFAILLDSSTMKIVKEASERERAILAARNNENGGYGGVKSDHADLERAKQELDFATNLGLGLIKDAAPVGKNTPVKPGTAPKPKPDESEFAAVLKSRQEVWDKLAELDKEYADKSFKTDKDEATALKDKFAEFKNIIINENIKIAAINESGKKNIKIIDIKLVDPIEKRAEEELAFKQGTDKIKADLAEKKQLYADYENYKKVLGQKNADAHFPQVKNAGKTYMQVLEDEKSALPAKDRTPLEDQKGKLLDNDISQERLAQQKNLDELLKEFQTYADKRADIVAKSKASVAALQAAGNTEEAQLAQEKGDQEVTSIDEANVKKWASYKNLFGNLEQLSVQSTFTAIALLEKELSAAGITAEAKKNLEKEILKVKKTAQTGSADELIRLADKLRAVGQSFAGINDNIVAMVGTVATAVAGVGDVKKQVAVIKKPETGTLDKLGAGMGIASAAFGVANSVLGYFKGLKAAKEAAIKYMKDYQDAAVKGELEYQALVRKREQDSVKRGKTNYQGMIAQLDLLKKQSPELQKAYDKVFTSIQGQEFVEGVGSKHGTWLRKAKTWDIMASLGGSDYAKMEELYLQGKLKNQAKSDFESLRSLREELKQSGIDVENLQEQINGLLTGTSVEGLSDVFADLVEGGRLSAKDLGDSFESILKKSIVNSFKYNVVQKAMQPLYEELTALTANGKIPSEEEIQGWKDRAKALGLSLSAQWDSISKTTGVSFEDKSSGDSGMANAIKGITAEEANLLAGQFGGLRLAQLEGNELAKQNTSSMSESLMEIRSQTLTLKEIELNTGRSADVEERFLPYLMSIDSKLTNTNNATRAAGI